MTLEEQMGLPWPPDHTWPVEELQEAANHPYDSEAALLAHSELERRGIINIASGEDAFAYL